MVEIIYIFLLFENIVAKYFLFFSYWDELITLVFLICLVFGIMKSRKLRIGILGKAGLCFVFVLFIGFVSTFVNGDLQDSPVAKLKDVLAISKLFVVFVGASKFYKKKKATAIVERCARVTRYIVIIISICAILDYTVGIGMHRGVRYIPLFIFLFSHATYAVASYIFMMTILITESVNKNKWYLCACSILIILTMRSKGIICVAIIWLLLFNRRYNLINWAYEKASGIKIKWKYIIVVALGVLWLLRDKISTYLSWGLRAARTGLYLVGFEIVRDYFPLGTGFGTFASFISGEYYSDIYYLYNMQNISGMTETNYNYISDVFWPYIYGEYGLFGFIAYTAMLLLLFKYCLKGLNAKTNVAYSIILIWLYSIVASFAEAFYTNSSVVQFALLIPLLLKFRDEKMCSNDTSQGKRLTVKGD